MKYLLDVNALVALGLLQHQFHSRLGAWVRAQASPQLLTCSITELGFVRVLAQAPDYGSSVSEAKALLQQMKGASAVTFKFIPDGNDIAHLPRWVKLPAQTTDGHLLQLAISHGATLATLDEKIPGAFLIP